MQALEFSSKEQTRAWVKSFAREFKRPCAVLLSGPLGAGKTQLVKWFLEDLGVADAASPTFAIHQEYHAKQGVIDHVDLYRLKSDADLESSGFWDLLRAPQGLLFVEWAERLPENVWPEHWKKIFISIAKSGESSRDISFAIRGHP
jgi:tRNA threonylcarbamoyladenosine biosynthesis protein TsaE